MTDVGSSDQGGRRAQHPLIEALAGQVDEPAVYTGYEGDAGAEGQVRIYLREDLTAHVDLPSDAIMHEQHDAPEPSKFWVRDSAPVRLTTRTRPMPLLAGNIVEEFYDESEQFNFELTAGQAAVTWTSQCDDQSFYKCISSTRGGCSHRVWCC